jgi:hypothetical protein
MEEVKKKLIQIPGISIELCGTWLWITGDTYPVRTELRATGCSYASKKKIWYFHEGPYKKMSNQELSLEAIELMFGCQVLS